MRKRLLCLSFGTVEAGLLLQHALPDWDIFSVASITEANQALRSDRYLVGLLIHDRELHRTTDIRTFLYRHSDMQWVGVFRRANLENVQCRDLVMELLSDYHTAPIDYVRLSHTLGHAHGWAVMRHLSAPGADSCGHGTSPLIGECSAIAQLRTKITRVAKVSASVLIWGESGTGKELTAQAIHAQSDRTGRPFVPVNCGAIAPTLVHSELFGYERGAFTGATRSKIGLIESAHGGTLFLDEIADLPKEMQANLLRFLQEKTICRLGSTRQIEVDVRVIAASHVRLQQAVALGAFREDLYYRLAVLPISVPPLRERQGDIAVLAEHFYRQYSTEKRPRLKGISSDAISAMLDHDWPGNIRELINRMRRALVMAEGCFITPADLGLGSIDAKIAGVKLNTARKGTERSTLRECLDRSGHNVSRAARALGVSRTTIYRLLDKHNMSP
jgi:DNA-binding NtrC family response regulator